MPSSSMALCFISLLLLLLLPLSSASFDAISSICNSTPDPTYCKSVLPTINSTADIYYQGKFSVRKSLSQARKFVALVDESLANRPALTATAVRALEDCRFLAAANLDFISTSLRAVKGISKLLPEKNAGDVQTLLSAALTNLDTCSDGLTAASAAGNNGLSPHLKNDSKLHSLSLALFTKGWVPEKKKHVGGWNPRRFTFSRGGVSVSMSRKARQVYEKATVMRTLLEENVDPVMVNDIVVVSQDGTGNFTTINDAVSAAPNNSDESDGYFMIYVTSGIYEEYVSIASYKTYIMMVGDGINQTIITGNRSVVDNFSTFDSATFAVDAANFIAVNLTFQNTAGAVKHQAVAVRSAADMSTFYSCSFEGYQDTLFLLSMRQFFRECDIYGTGDFIFGNALVVFQTCNIYLRIPVNGLNYITAQGRTDPNQNTGTSIHNCTIRAAPDLASSNASSVKTYLGRPWKEYSRTVFMQCFLDNLIDPAGWREWNATYASTLYYAEYDNTGPGSDTSARVTWPGYHVINDVDARNFTASNLLLGDTWLPLTGTPYMGGLI